MNEIRVLIITDRLFKQAVTLANYLRNTEIIKVIGIAETKKEALNIAKEYAFDYLIIAGYLSESNYDIVAELQKQ